MDSWTFVKQVAEALRVNDEAFRKWRINGVPYRYRVEIIDAAERDGFPLDRDVFDHPPGRRRAAEAA